MDEWPDPSDRYLRALFARARPSTLVKVRWRTLGRHGRRFARVDHLDWVVEIIGARAVSTDVFVGALPRWRRRGGRGAIVGDARTVWSTSTRPRPRPG